MRGSLSGKEMLPTCRPVRFARSCCCGWSRHCCWQAATRVPLLIGGHGSRKPAEPAVPPEIQGAAEALLGSESKVLVFGDLRRRQTATTGGEHCAKTPKENITGTIVTAW